MFTLRLILIGLLFLSGILLPGQAQAELDIADIMAPPYNASTANVAQIVLDNLNPLMTANPDFSDFSSSNDPYASTPNPNDKGRGVKAEEAATMSQMGVLDAQGKASILSVTGILLQTTSFVVAPGGFGLIMDPEKVEAGGILASLGQQEGQQLAAMTESYQKNYAQQQLLRNKFGEPDPDPATITINDSAPAAAPSNTDLPSSVGSLGLYDALGIDAAAAQAALNRGDIAGFQGLLKDGIESSGFRPSGSGSVTEEFLSSLGLSSDSFFAANDVVASDRGGGLRVEATEYENEDPFFLDKRKDVHGSRLGVMYGANEDNAIGTGPSAFAGSLVGIESDDLEDPHRPKTREQILEQARRRRLEQRNSLDERKLQAMGISRPLPGTTIFDIAHSGYQKWRQYRNQVFLATNP
ncbi:MAG: hypothetical protein KDD51_14190 [Bdellovibrionales bacterium]|nr:hypothetical protein [Bdellovibrionales bacterium]